MAAHACRSAKFLFVAFFWKKTTKKTFQKTTFSFHFKKLSFRKCFLNKNIFVSKNYFCFGKTFTFLKYKYFRFKNKNSFIQPRLQASILQYWLTSSQPPIPHAQSIRFSWPKRYHPLTLSHKLDVFFHKSLKEISPGVGHHNKERLGLAYTSASHSSQLTNNNCQAQTCAQYDRELLEPDIEVGNLQIKLSQVETLALSGGWHAWATTKKLMRFFSVFFTKCFRNKSESVSETKMLLCRKHLRTESVYEMK